MRIALPFPRRRGDAPAERRRPGMPATLLALVVLAALVGGLLFWRAQAGAVTTPPIPVPVLQGDLEIIVESSGAVKPAASVDLPFLVTGQVREVLVKPGQSVTAGQPLARLDDRELRLQLQQAEADLKTAQARLDQARAGAATPQDLAQAQAGLEGAEAQLQQARSGGVTGADVRGAEATLRSAQARLDALKNPSADKLSTARLQLSQAQANLQTTRDNESAAKTRAELDLKRAAEALTQAQSAYSTALQNWQYVQDTGNDPINPSVTGANGKEVANSLNDAQRQRYYDAFVQAGAALHSAEAAVQQAQVAYDNARQQEAVNVQQAEAQAADAQQQVDALMHPSRTDIAQAQADVDAARARLDGLRQGGSAASIAAAQAQVDQARAGLEKLTAPAAAPDLAAAEAGVAQAEALLDAAKLKLDRATLVAPFAGTVAAVNIVPGSVAGTGAALALVDSSTMHLDVDVSESDVARVTLGQPVNITFDALEGTLITGTVESIATTPTSGQDVVTYLVQVRFEPGTTPVKVGMSASAAITVETHAGVIKVSNRAITSAGSQKTVQVLYGAQQTPVTVRVETGATDGSMTEIVRCVDTGKQCLREGDQVALNLPTDSGQAGGPGGGNRMVFGPGGGGPGSGAPVQIRIER